MLSVLFYDLLGNCLRVWLTNPSADHLVWCQTCIDIGTARIVSLIGEIHVSAAMWTTLMHCVLSLTTILQFSTSSLILLISLSMQSLHLKHSFPLILLIFSCWTCCHPWQASAFILRTSQPTSSGSLFNNLPIIYACLPSLSDHPSSSPILSSRLQSASPWCSCSQQLLPLGFPPDIVRGHTSMLVAYTKPVSFILLRLLPHVALHLPTLALFLAPLLFVTIARQIGYPHT